MDRFIITQNIAHFRERLAKEMDEETRRTLTRMLAEAEQGLKQLDHGAPISDAPGRLVSTSLAPTPPPRPAGALRPPRL